MICTTRHLRKRSATVLWAFDACKQNVHLHWESKMDPNPNHFQVSSNVLHVMFCNLTWRELSLGFKALGSEVRLNRVKWLLHNNPVFYLWQVSQNICGANMYFRLSLTQTFPGVGFFPPLSTSSITGVPYFWWVFMFLWVSPHHLPSLCHSVLSPPVLALYCYKCEALSHPCIMCSQVCCLTVLDPAYCRVRVYMLSVIELVSWLFMCVYDVVC